MTYELFKLARAQRVRGIAKRAVLCELALRANAKGECVISFEELAKAIGGSRKTAQRAVAELAPYLERKRRSNSEGHRLADCYTLLVAKLASRPTGQNGQANRSKRPLGLQVKMTTHLPSDTTYPQVEVSGLESVATVPPRTTTVPLAVRATVDSSESKPSTDRHSKKQKEPARENFPPGYSDQLAIYGPEVVERALSNFVAFKAANRVDKPGALFAAMCQRAKASSPAPFPGDREKTPVQLEAERREREAQAADCRELEERMAQCFHLPKSAFATASSSATPPTAATTPAARNAPINGARPAGANLASRC